MVVVVRGKMTKAKRKSSTLDVVIIVVFAEVISITIMSMKKIVRVDMEIKRITISGTNTRIHECLYLINNYLISILKLKFI